MNEQNKNIVAAYIQEIWNRGQMDKIDTYLHAGFKDTSLPAPLPPDKEGVKMWITATGSSFEHKTIIDAMVAEGDKVMIKITMQLRHTGTWRGIAATGKDITTIGYRYFILAGGKIIAHAALLDGNAIEQQLRDTATGCKVQQ